MIVWPCPLNFSGPNGLMLWEEVWLGIWSDYEKIGLMKTDLLISFIESNAVHIHTKEKTQIDSVTNLTD